MHDSHPTSSPSRTTVTCLRGTALLHDPLLNKDSAFSPAEREALGLQGLVPPHQLSIDQQVALALEHIRAKGDDLEKFIGLVALQDRNETLFYRVLVENLTRADADRVHAHGRQSLPAVQPHLPSAARAVDHAGRRGPHPGTAAERPAEGRPFDRRHGQRADSGAGRPGGRRHGHPDRQDLAVLSPGPAFIPSQCLPVSLDVGTNNAELLNDPFYLGYRRRRLRGAEYDLVVERFVDGVRQVFPNALVQWEDFHKNIAFAVLDRYRKRITSFNDDIQGTAAVGRGRDLLGDADHRHAAGRAADSVRGGRRGRRRDRPPDAFGHAGSRARRRPRSARQVFTDSRGWCTTGRQLDDPHKREFAMSAPSDGSPTA